MDGTCDVPGCTNKTFMGWRPLTEPKGKQICEYHFNRHKDPADGFNLWDAFGFRKPAGVNKPASKKDAPCLAPEPDRGRVVCTEPDVTREPSQAEPDRPEPEKAKPQTVPATEKPPGCKACGAEREAGHSYCRNCAAERRTITRRQAQSRYWRKQHISCGSD